MLEVFDKVSKRLAFLQNAYDVQEEKKINTIYKLRFTLPESDAKNIYCVAFNTVRKDGGQLYRIMPEKTEQGLYGEITYEAEHCIASLLDTVIFGFTNVGGLGYYTKDVINYVLSKQPRKDWVLGECDFARQFEYGWEQENLIGCLFSIPNRFIEKYMWVYNTQNYPYVVSLKKIDDLIPKVYIRSGKNKIAYRKNSNPEKICTKLYALGSGEGANQVTMRDVNNGIPYILAPQHLIDKYGIVEKIWTDRRYETSQTLYEAAQVILQELQEPLVSHDVEFSEDVEIGDCVKIVDANIISYVIETKKDYGNVNEMSVVISNKTVSIASSIADLSDRQRIESTYSQGASQIYADSTCDNADKETPLDVYFYIDDAMINVNAVKIKIKLSEFRAYSKASEGGGGFNTTSGGGGSVHKSTSDGGAFQTSTKEGGSYQITSEGGGAFERTAINGGVDRYTEYAGNSPGYTSNSPPSTGSGMGGVPQPHTHPMSHYHSVDWRHKHAFEVESHTHQFEVGDHSHGVDLPDHTHGVETSDHTHDVELPDHTHPIETPDHVHEINPVIEFFGNPTSFELHVNDVKVGFYEGRDLEMDITDLLTKNGLIPRGMWHKISVYPDDLARIEVNYNILGFIQSRGERSV